MMIAASMPPPRRLPSSSVARSSRCRITRRCGNVFHLRRPRVAPFILIVLFTCLGSTRLAAQPLHPGKHPRLFFGAEDVPGTLSRLNSPFGREVDRRLAALRTAGVPPWLQTNQAVGWALRYAWRGDSAAALKALDLCEESLNAPELGGDGSLPLCETHASKVVGIAICYDLAQAAWPRARRDAIASALLTFALNPVLPDSVSARVPAGGDFILAQAASGLAALAIEGDPGVPADAANAASSVRDLVVRYLASLGDHGWPREGLNQLRIPLSQGLGAFLIAWRRNHGEDLVAASSARGWPALYTTLLLPPPSPDRVPDLPLFGLAPSLNGRVPGPRWMEGPLAGGDTALLMVLADAGSRAALQWTYQHCFGQNGDGNFDVTKPSDAIFALEGMTSSEPAAAPDTLIPRVWADSQQGVYLFRNRWEDSNDSIAAITANARPTRGLASFGDAGSFRLLALGGRWAVQRNRDIEDLDTPAPERENVVVIPGTQGWLPGKVLRASGLPDGSGSVSINLDAVFTVAPTNPNSPRLEPTQDIGIRALRAWTVDYSGESGAPVLMAVADHITGAPARRWLMHTEEGDIHLKPDGFELQAANGATLKATVISPSSPRISVEQGRWSNTISMVSNHDFFVIMTVEPAGHSHPRVSCTGSGLGARVHVGGSTVYFDGQNVAIE